MTPELLAAMRRFKSALTRARNRRDHRKVIAVVDDRRAYFAERDMPLPDDWALWANAREEAEFELRRPLRLSGLADGSLGRGERR